jgi:hypothetical protein
MIPELIPRMLNHLLTLSMVEITSPSIDVAELIPSGQVLPGTAIRTAVPLQTLSANSEPVVNF